jgi:aminoglycoside phosphotransferase (APT) family kinase protein
VFSEDQVCAALALLRRFHDALADDLVCHGDFGPWNLVWRDGLPSAVIDFDSVYRGDRSEDVAYALRMFIAYGRAEAEPSALVAITRSATNAYGCEFDVPSILDREYERAAVRCRKNGWTRQLAVLPLERGWLSANRDLF